MEFSSRNDNMIRQHRFGARSEYRRQESQRVRDSATLAETFRNLKSLTVNLEYFDPTGVRRTSHIKYEVNLKNGKAVFRFDCPNPECIRGDFDLSEELARAVAAHRTTGHGELVCKGWRSKTTINSVRCQQILRYKFRLGY